MKRGQLEFPPVKYDYVRAGVGLRNKPVELDDAEVRRVLAFLSYKGEQP